MKDGDKLKVYLCGVAWQHEVDATDVAIWPSKESAEKNMKCSSSCGLVEAELSFVKWVIPQERNPKGVSFSVIDEEESEARLKEIEQLIGFDPPVDSPLGKRLKWLALIQERYEKHRYPDLS